MSSLEDLVERTELASIEIHELKAEARLNRASGVDTTPDEVKIESQVRHARGAMGFRLRATLDTGRGRARVIVAAIFEVKGDDPGAETVREFANRVAFLTIAPYLREALADITLKVFGEAYQLALVRVGDVAVGVRDDRPSESSSAD